MKRGIYLSFWAKQSGNAMTHAKGLTQEQIDEFKSLKPGDRLILFKNEVKEERDPAYTLKVFNPPNKDDTGGI